MGTNSLNKVPQERSATSGTLLWAQNDVFHWLKDAVHELPDTLTSVSP